MQPWDLATSNPKQERIRHASLSAGKLPPAFITHTQREEEMLAAAAAFWQRWAAGGSCVGRLSPPVTLLNECGVQKVVCTTVRPTLMPHTDLQDLPDIARVWE